MFFNSALKARIAELELHLKNSTELNSQKSKTIDNLREARTNLQSELAYRDKQREAVTVKRMVGLKFKALFNGLYQPTEFKTGPGPCGKTVTHFTTSRTERELTIHQHHTDGSSKAFEYRLSDIDGRIQYDYENLTVYGEEAERERALQALIRRPRFA
uniref:Uncharacterized protein n=3 Tax=unclassified Kayfunavirus TaxID=2749939 RepID=A0AAU8GDI5_9CAUD